MNVIYELNQYNSLLLNSNKINNKPVLTQKELRMEEFTGRLSYISNEFPGYKKYLMIPVDKYIDNPRNSSIWSKREYLYIFLMQLIRQILDNPSQFSKLKDWTFIFNNINEVFYIECKDINSGTFELIKSNFKKFKSRRGLVDVADTDDEELGETEDDNEVNIPSINQKNTITAASEVVKTVNSLPIPDQSKEELKKTAVSAIKKVYVQNSKNSVEISDDTFNNAPNKDKTSKKITDTNILSDSEKAIDKVPENSTKSSENKLLPKEDLMTAGDVEIKKELNKLILPDQKMSVQRLARMQKIQKEMKDIKVNA